MTGILNKLKRFVAGKAKDEPAGSKGLKMTEAKIKMLEQICKVAETANPPDYETIEYAKRRLYEYQAARREREYYRLYREGGRGDSRKS